MLAQVGRVSAAADTEGVPGSGEVHARLLVVVDEGVAMASCGANTAKAFL